MNDRQAKVKALCDKAQAYIATKTTRELCEMRNETTQRMDGGPTTDERMELSLVRAWISDELEARDAKAFGAWMDGVGDDPSAYFNEATA